MRRISSIILIFLGGWFAGIIEISLLNKISNSKSVIDLILLTIYFTMLFMDITPAIFLIVWLGFLRDIFTGQYIGANVFTGLSLYALFLFIREKVNEEDKIFQITFVALLTFLWMIFLNRIIFQISFSPLNLLLKCIINAAIAPVFFKFFKLLDAWIEDVFERRQIRKHNTP